MAHGARRQGRGVVLDGPQQHVAHDLPQQRPRQDLSTHLALQRPMKNGLNLYLKLLKGQIAISKGLIKADLKL